MWTRGASGPGMDRRWARRAQCPRAQQDLRSTRALNGRGHCIGGSPGIHAGEDVPAGQFGFTADASAVVLTAGAATQATFVDGVAVVVQPLSGVMVEAAIGGQKFTYQAQ